jgi:hypothetical protein
MDCIEDVTTTDSLEATSRTAGEEEEGWNHKRSIGRRKIGESRCRSWWRKRACEDCGGVEVGWKIG